MKKEPDPIRKQLNSLLIEIGAKQTAVALMEKCMAAEIEKATAQFAPYIKVAQEDLKAIEAELLGLAKYNKATLFPDTERVNLKHGAVLRTIQEGVKKIKKMLDKLKAAGRLELIRKVESPDWDAIEKLTNDELAQLGTKRQKKEIFSYDLKVAR